MATPEKELTVEEKKAAAAAAKKAAAEKAKAEKADKAAATAKANAELKAKADAEKGQVALTEAGAMFTELQGRERSVIEWRENPTESHALPLEEFAPRLPSLSLSLFLLALTSKQPRQSCDFALSLSILSHVL